MVTQTHGTYSGESSARPGEEEVATSRKGWHLLPAAPTPGRLRLPLVARKLVDLATELEPVAWLVGGGDRPHPGLVGGDGFFGLAE